ncbi:PEP-utilizing enzyme [Actinocorallia sp. B10E7]|uniref:PEP-utilizing enzyme n=1 Tax=Actinocorallia sp. B10E7 TaxID=3153558 RepID=UPI00325F6914
MTGRFPEIDIDPHPRFGVYSAGNLGEVAPQRLSPMSWSLVGTPMERGTRRLVRNVWGERAWAQGDHYVFLGYFGCRPYHNLSAYAHLSRQLPRVRPEDVTAAYFEGVESPPSAAARESRLGKAAAVPRLVRELGRLGPTLRRLEEDVYVLESLARTAITLRSEAGLTETVLKAADLLDDAWAAHIVTTTGLVPLTVLQRSLNDRVLGRYGEVEPYLNRPRELVWSRLHRFAGGDDLLPGEFLDSSFYEVADDRLPWQPYAVRHRVVAEGTAHSSGVLDPAEAQWGMLGKTRGRIVKSLARVVGETMASREHSKSLVMRLLHVHRRVLPHLAAAWNTDDDLWPYLTIEEFRRLYREPGLAERVPARRAAVESALRTPMPEHLDMTGGVPRVWADDLPKKARGVSPGKVTGVVVHAEDDFPEDVPCILVCESADADVAPLLGYVDGVLTQRGSDMSHIAILAREYHLPAVVGCALVKELKPNDMVTINGTTGEVYVEQ